MHSFHFLTYHYTKYYNELDYISYLKKYLYVNVHVFVYLGKIPIINLTFHCDAIYFAMNAIM